MANQIDFMFIINNLIKNYGVKTNSNKNSLRIFKQFKKFLKKHIVFARKNKLKDELIKRNTQFDVLNTYIKLLKTQKK